MNKLNEIINNLGISKVRLAKYLGVSRQMLYNYLAMNSINDWPKEKSTRLYALFNITNENEIDNIIVNNEFVKEVENKIENDNKDCLSKDITNELKSFNKKEQELLTNIISILKDDLSNDKTKDAFYAYTYLFNILKEMNNIKELKYYFAFISKHLGATSPMEFVFNKDLQYTFEGIMWSGYILYENRNINNLSKLKIAEAHKRFVKDIETKNEEVLGRTQELNTARNQALKELGYTEITEDNAKEVLDKIAEIETRKVNN